MPGADGIASHTLFLVKEMTSIRNHKQQEGTFEKKDVYHHDYDSCFESK